MSDIQQLTKRIVDFCNARDWKQFHNPKDLAVSLTLEATEVLEHFQWKTPEEIEKYIKTNKNDIADELADVLYWVLLMSFYLKIDISESLNEKMGKNEAKYPIEKAKGRHDKYTELEKI